MKAAPTPSRTRRDFPLEDLAAAVEFSRLPLRTIGNARVIAGITDGRGARRVVIAIDGFNDVGQRAARHLWWLLPRNVEVIRGALRAVAIARPRAEEIVAPALGSMGGPRATFAGDLAITASTRRFCWARAIDAEDPVIGFGRADEHGTYRGRPTILKRAEFDGLERAVAWLEASR